VTARVLLAIFDSVYLLALSGLVGSILFFLFGVAPILSRVLGEELGRKLMEAMVPFYHVWGVICCAIALPALICGAFCFPELRGLMVGVQALMIMASLVLLLFSISTMTPMIHEAHDKGPTSRWRFERLYQGSVRFNTIVLVIGIVLLVGFAVRKGLRTDGIEEPSPKVRANPAVSKSDRP
jgi:MFS family permease